MSEKTGFRQVRGESSDEHDMAQIRELLFGEHSRQTSRQLEQFEVRIREQEQALRRLLDQRLDQRLTDATQALRDDLDQQSRRQQANLDGLDTALRALFAKTDERVTLVDSELQASTQVLNELALSVERLQQGHVGRVHLAEMLEAMAQRLRQSAD